MGPSAGPWLLPSVSREAAAIPATKQSTEVSVGWNFDFAACTLMAVLGAAIAPPVPGLCADFRRG